MCTVFLTGTEIYNNLFQNKGIATGSTVQHTLCACELPTSEATPFPVACAEASSVEASAGALIKTSIRNK